MLKTSFVLGMMLLSMLLWAGTPLSAGSDSEPVKEKLAVAEPQVKGGAMTPDEASGLADVLETKVNDTYELISRANLKPMMTEIGFQTGSDLVNQKDQLVKLSQIKGVKYLLTSTISKLGKNFYLSLSIVNCGTGQIDPKKRTSVSGKDFDQLLAHLDNALIKMGIGIDPNEGNTAKMAVLRFDLAGVSNSGDLADRTASQLQSELMKKTKFDFVDRQAIDKVLSENKFAKLDEAAPDQYTQIGQLLVADYLVSGTITRFRSEEISVDNSLTGGNSKRYVGKLEGHVRVVRVKDGVVMFSEPVSISFKKTDIPVAERKDWTARDYEDAIIQRAVEKTAAAIEKSKKLNP